MPRTRIPCSASSGRRRSFQHEYCSSTNSWVASLISSRSSTMVRPSGVVELWPSSSCCNRPPTRTSKNSSRLLAEMARNFTRSSSGLRRSPASSSTRQLNFSHEDSRLRRGARLLRVCGPYGQSETPVAISGGVWMRYVTMMNRTSVPLRRCTNKMRAVLPHRASILRRHFMSVPRLAFPPDHGSGHSAWNNSSARKTLRHPACNSIPRQQKSAALPPTLSI